MFYLPLLIKSCVFLYCQDPESGIAADPHTPGHAQRARGSKAGRMRKRDERKAVDSCKIKSGNRSKSGDNPKAGIIARREQFLRRGYTER